jgi:Ca-activated chloride channel family protein
MSQYGRASTVRSHRRGGARRRFKLAPWLITGTVLVLVAAGATAGYTYFVKDSCSGQARASLLVAPSVEPIISSLAKSWEGTSPSVNGTCAAVTVTAKDSSLVATALAEEWDPKTEGPAPDVWVPDSSAWVRKASVDADAERIIPDLQPSLARTPTVIAMPKVLAEAAGMVDKPLTWQQIIGLLQTPGGWAAFQHPELGDFKVALSDPQVSTAGLLALMAISDTDDSGDVSNAEQTNLLSLKKVVSQKVGSTQEIFQGLRTAAAKSPADGLSYVTAFAALEQDVVTYNKSHPAVPLVAIYPQDGTAEADFPYLVLRGAWADKQRQEVAQAFLRYLRGSVGKVAFQQADFRDANRLPGPDLTAANGVNSKVTALPRAILLPESVQRAAASWTAVTRPTNMLLVFDTSGSMGTEVLGAGKSRLDLTKAAALGALDLLDGSAQVGVWSFSTAQAGKDYRELIPLGQLSLKEGTRTHRDAVSATVGGLQAGGNTGLYNTTWAACQQVSSRYQQGAANLVVVLTDGADDNNISGSLTLDQLITNLKGTCASQAKPVQVITIGLGVDSDSDILRQISASTNATSFSSPTSFDISQVMLTALFQ